MEECFRDIQNFDVRYEKAKGCCRTEFNMPEASLITEMKPIKKPGPCYKCGGLHFQANCINQMANINNKFQNRTLTQQTYQGNITYKFCNNKDNSNMFPVGTLSFQAPQQVQSSDDMLVSICTIKCFLEK